jgi:hypothetical protein
MMVDDFFLKKHMLIVLNFIDQHDYFLKELTLGNIRCCTTDLADIMKQLLTKYDNLFETSFPYSMGWHGKTCVFWLCFSILMKTLF